MGDKDYLALLLECEEYSELLEKYNTRDLSLIAEIIIREERLR